LLRNAKASSIGEDFTKEQTPKTKSLGDVLAEIPDYSFIFSTDLLPQSKAPAPAPQNGAPIPVTSTYSWHVCIETATVMSPPVDQHRKLGWCGACTREQAEAKLVNKPDKTFLVRWSQTTNSIVVSYRKKPTFVHLSGALLSSSGKCVVQKEDGSVETFPNLLDYITSIKKRGAITDPIS
jgi:hypothetical protein